MSNKGISSILPIDPDAKIVMLINVYKFLPH